MESVGDWWEKCRKLYGSGRKRAGKGRKGLEMLGKCWNGL